MNKFMTWLKGFKKCNMCAPLRQEPQELTVSAISETFAPFAKFVESIPVTRVRMGVKEYSIKLVDSELVMANLDIYNRNYGYTKVSCEGYMHEGKREFRVTDSIIAKGIDKKLWRVVITSFLICDTKNKKYDESLIYECQKLNISLLNTLKKDYYLDNMFMIPVSILPIYKQDRLHRREFDGYVKTYGELDMFHNYGINELSPLSETNDATTLQDSIGKGELNDILKDESMILNVIHKGDNKPRK